MLVFNSVLDVTDLTLDYVLPMPSGHAISPDTARTLPDGADRDIRVIRADHRVAWLASLAAKRAVRGEVKSGTSAAVHVEPESRTESKGDVKLAFDGKGDEKRPEKQAVSARGWSWLFLTVQSRVALEFFLRGAYLTIGGCSLRYASQTARWM